ncbi:MAG TPA: hypothetical protein VM536_17445 [Chloroflexia bacterium]|nr:hypothetical protein [Chloroflexia bacterium]
MDIHLRLLATIPEYKAAEQLQQVCWGSASADSVPSHMMITLQHEGGLVLGAFTPDDMLVGFVLGFLGREGDQLKHCSHMAAVLPEYRNRNIAYRLKVAQRDFVLAAGLDLCTWTFDPLLCPNAVLNLAKLGAISRTYRRNIYGSMDDVLNAGLPTDRLYLRWELTTPRVRACMASGRNVDAPVAQHLLTDVTFAGDVPLLAATRPLPDEPLLGIQIPRHLGVVRGYGKGAMLTWRAGTGTLLEAAFAAGYTVVNMTPDAEHPDLLGRYTLAREA